jgi:peptidoglycan/LPS O-acetylase OafA/YrhL
VALLCVGVLLATVLYRNELFRLTLRFTLQSLAIAGLLHLAVLRPDRPAWRWLNTPALVYLGSVSYTIYLSHHLILLALARHWPQLGWAGLTLAGALLTLALAELMRRAVDRPCARLRRRLHRNARPGAQQRNFLAPGWS